MRNANARKALVEPTVNVFRLALIAAPAFAAWVAFSQSAQAHVLDVLIGQGACGNPLMTPDAPMIFGHCLDCWSAGARAGLAMLFALLLVRGVTTPRLRTA
jgi:hypothetical protein